MGNGTVIILLTEIWERVFMCERGSKYLGEISRIMAPLFSSSTKQKHFWSHGNNISTTFTVLLGILEKE